MSELKKCPFCGGEAFLDTHRFWDEKSKDFTVQTYGVRCYDCQTGNWQHYRKQEDAIKQWNTRKLMANIVEKLEEEKSDCGERTGYFKGIEKAINIVKQEINNGLE